MKDKILTFLYKGYFTLMIAAQILLIPFLTKWVITTSNNESLFSPNTIYNVVLVIIAILTAYFSYQAIEFKKTAVIALIPLTFITLFSISAYLKTPPRDFLLSFMNTWVIIGLLSLGNKKKFS